VRGAGRGVRGCGERDVLCTVCVNWDEHLSAFQVHDSGVGRGEERDGSRRDDVMDEMGGRIQMISW